MQLLLFVLGLFFIIMSVSFVKESFSRTFLLGLMFVDILVFKGMYENNTSINEIALLFILMSNVLIFLVSLILKNLPKKNTEVVEKVSKDRYLLFKLYLFSLLSLFFILWSIGGYNSVSSSWLVIKNEMDSNSLISLLSTFLFIYSLINLRKYYVENNSSMIEIILPTLILLLFVFILRIKLFIIPIILIFLIPKTINEIDLKKFMKISIVLIASYFVVMFARWLGDLSSMTLESLYATLLSVYNAGVEREMYHQFTSVFEYYFNTSNFHYGSAYFRLFFEPINRIFSLDILFENPMYQYYTISNNFVFVEGGSAHPSLYVDSYASLNFFGVIIPASWLFIIYIIEKGFLLKKDGEIIFVAFTIALPLLVRGSVFYAMLYFILIMFFWLIRKSIKFKLKRMEKK